MQEISSTEYWTTACFSEELFQCLAGYKQTIQKNGQILTISPYKDQAARLMYRIPIYNPIPPFVINWNHLTQKIQNEIVQLQMESSEFERIIVDSVGRLFEILNSRYYNGSVRRYLKVKFVNE